MNWTASTAFGLEGQTARDLRRLGIEQVMPRPTGGVDFTATPEQAFRANLWLRCADRVLLTVGRFEARSFEELFEQVRALRQGESNRRAAASVSRRGASPFQVR